MNVFAAMKILVIEDEPKVAAFIKQGLEENGYETQVVFDGQMGLRAAAHGLYDLILLDVVIPYINGLDLCKRIKASQPNTPVVMLTALGTTDDKLTGFESGADDYLIKPFEFKELLARIKAILRRNNASTGAASPNNSLKLADLELNLDKKLAIRGGKEIELTAKEFLLLEFLLLNRERVVSRAEIAEKVWEITFDTGTNVVDVYVNILRKKVDRDFELKLIKTRIGLGYMMSQGV